MSELRQTFPLAALLKAAGLSRSTFYYRLSARACTTRRACLKEDIQRVYREHKGRYGYRRITAAIRKAYADVLRGLNVDEDIAGYADLRRARDEALWLAAQGAGEDDADDATAVAVGRGSRHGSGRRRCQAGGGGGRRRRGVDMAAGHPRSSRRGRSLPNSICAHVGATAG